VGTEFLFRGERVQVEADPAGGGVQVRLDGEILRFGGEECNLRYSIEHRLRRVAQLELPARVIEFARAHNLSISRVAIRDQRSRWGSCSRRGTVSLNWRLIQTPGFVQDYIILHELMHLREMNHSAKFWAQVERVCPDYLVAERWIKANRDLLGRH
jgi:predicted metal-dependent hydrolase